jgi:hypothetical protein
MTHTPGPWEASMNPWHDLLPKSERTLDISVGNKLIAKDIDPNDARLIAASPELLLVCKEALEQIIKAEDYESDCMPDYSIVDRLTAVIAKAEGKP